MLLKSTVEICKISVEVILLICSRNASQSFSCCRLTWKTKKLKGTLLIRRTASHTAPTLAYILPYRFSQLKNRTVSAKFIINLKGQRDTNTACEHALWLDRKLKVHKLEVKQTVLGKGKKNGLIKRVRTELCLGTRKHFH